MRYCIIKLEVGFFFLKLNITNKESLQIRVSQNMLKFFNH